MILEKIISVKQEEIAHAKHLHPIDELKAVLGDTSSSRIFRDTLSAHHGAIIAEIKKRSPSRGMLREDVNHRQVASMYQDHGAAAISVLTDQHFFGGNISDLSDIRKIVTLPILRKDFIIDDYQIYETKVTGGDALLLIAGILSDNQLTEFIDLTDALGLSSLVEVHSETDLDRAVACGATMIGINNRNLHTFRTDINISLHMASRVPPGKVLVSESGIRTRQDIEMLMKVGFHAFLIGETLMRAEHIGNTIGQLLGRS